MNIYKALVASGLILGYYKEGTTKLLTKKQVIEAMLDELKNGDKVLISEYEVGYRHEAIFISWTDASKMYAIVDTQSNLGQGTIERKYIHMPNNVIN